MSINETIAETVGFDNFAVKIEDGSMVITPSDAGIAIFAHVGMTENSLAEAAELEEKMEARIEELRDDNAFLRDLLEETVETIENTYPELAARLLLVAYPIVGIEEDGTIVEVDENE